MEHITPSQAASTLGVSVRTVYRRLRNGKIPGTRDNNRWRVDPSHLPGYKTVDPYSGMIEEVGADGRVERWLPGEREFAGWITEKKKEKDNAAT